MLVPAKLILLSYRIVLALAQQVDRNCMCGPGYKVVRKCDVQNGSSVSCAPCIEGKEFSGRWDEATTCEPCPRKCRVLGQKFAHKCYVDQQNRDICQCEPGYSVWHPSNNFCSKNPCPPDHIKGTDGRCTPCEPGFYNPNPFGKECQKLPTSSPCPTENGLSTQTSSVTSPRQGVTSVVNSSNADSLSCQGWINYTKTQVLLLFLGISVLVNIAVLSLCCHNKAIRRLVHSCRGISATICFRHMWTAHKPDKMETATSNTDDFSLSDGMAMSLLSNAAHCYNDIVTRLKEPTGRTFSGNLFEEKYKDILAILECCAKTSRMWLTKPGTIIGPLPQRRPIRIAIVDSGANLHHPALKRSKVQIVMKENVIPGPGERRDTITDIFGHGTQILSHYCHLWQNDLQMVEFVIIKAICDDGQFKISALKAAVSRLLHKDYESVDIVSLSADLHLTPAEESDAARLVNMLKQRKIIICASSNTGARYCDTISYPANSTISIGSTDAHCQKSKSSPSGRDLHFVTYGEDFPVANKHYGAQHQQVYTLRSGASFAVPVAVSFVVHFLCQLELNLPESNLYTPEGMKHLNTTRGMMEVLKNMAKYPEHDKDIGYGPLLPYDNVFRDYFTFMSVVIKSLQPAAAAIEQETV